MRAETQGEAADHQEVETASEPTKDATVTLVHGDGKGGVPRDPPEPDPFCRQDFFINKTYFMLCDNLISVISQFSK